MDKIIEITNDEDLKNIKNNWDKIDDQNKIKQMLITTMIYQLLKPLNWIKMQETIFKYKIKESFEFGTENSLTEMLNKTADMCNYEISCYFVPDNINLFIE